MTKITFMNELQRALLELRVQDVEDVLGEYEAHFALKLADGCSEEEIAKRLGSPQILATQFAPEADSASLPPGRKGLTSIGLGVSDVGAGMFFILFGAWILCLAVAAAAFFALGACLLFRINPAGLIPSMPYIGALLFGIATLALTLLTALGTLYCAMFLQQLFRAYARWHRNVMAGATGKPIYPGVPAYPQIPAVQRRRIRALLLTSLAVLAAFSAVAYIVSAISAGSLEFWHVWNWFQA